MLIKPACLFEIEEKKTGKLNIITDAKLNFQQHDPSEIIITC